MLSKGWWVRARACKQSTRSLTHVYPSKTSNLSLALMRTIMQMYRRRKAIEEYNIILKKNSNFSSPLLFYEMVYLPSFAFLLVGVVAVAEANFSKPPVCKMTGDAYPPSMKPLPTGEPKNITTFIVVSKICVTSRRRTGAGLFN